MMPYSDGNGEKDIKKEEDKMIINFTKEQIEDMFIERKQNILRLINSYADVNGKMQTAELHGQLKGMREVLEAVFKITI